jgi:group I intron endonuclease
MLIYKITNKINGKSYIGYTSATISKRWNEHIKKLYNGTNRKLYDAMRKYGEENFYIEEIDRDDSATKEEWLHLETLYIIVYDSVDNGYNMTYGGIGGNTCGGKSLKGKTCYDKWVREFGIEEANRRKREMYLKVSEKNRKNPPHTKWTNEQKSAMSNLALQKGWKPPITRLVGEKHPMYGKTHTNKSKEKISAARRGKAYEECMPQETAKRLKELHRNQFLGEKNPNYIDIPKDELYDLLINKKLKVADAATHFKVSLPTIIDKTKKCFGTTPSLLRKQYENKN